MAAGRREAAGLLAAWHVASVAAMFGAEVDPRELNPFRVHRPPSAKMQALLDWRRKRQWKAFARDAAALKGG